MIISENHFGKENCVAYCDVLIRRNYEVINADEHFYHFVEKLVGINFLDIVHQDNLKDFKMAFETLKPGENCRMLILLLKSDVIFFQQLRAGTLWLWTMSISTEQYFLHTEIICLITILIRICLQYICTVVISAMHLLRELWNSLGKEC